MFAEYGRITADDLERGMKTFAGLRMKLNNFHKQLDGSQKWNTTDEDRVPIRPEWTTVDRILDTRFVTSLSPRKFLYGFRFCIILSGSDRNHLFLENCQM